ncbi:aldehyde dehydrogenase family protein [Protofrankia symbiont of Coriaria ruscifolia]|uniref:aldehyde dehydrogenase family protein n=1 Tax=Protofrankia symbiont of Coriaria ruscifolia TaxID=1306542 RepID=UPI0013EF66E7|nr:aldehyde dehydrogenase family protein [Protofrankia symbiont of Coriaria ruscifolia]
MTAKQHSRILGYITSGVEQGATPACGGGVPGGERFERGHWIEPTIFTGVRNDMRIAREEIFGPVLSVITYRTDEEAIAIANDTSYGLASSLWSGDNDRADHRERDRGRFALDQRRPPEVPFGGYKNSGLGREFGPDALDEYTETKNVHLDLSGRRGRRPYDVLLSHAG